MQSYRACSVVDTCEALQRFDRRLVRESPHIALLFREQMINMMHSEPRVGLSNSEFGVFSVETVEKIVRRGDEILEALGATIRMRPQQTVSHEF